jgi:threonine dehydrogenase-like Zn-dependent dehydrogenase
VRVPHADCNLLKVPWPRARLAPEIAFLCGDVLATGFYASSLATGEAVRASDARIVVFRAGPIGLACAYVLRYAGRPPILIDPDPARISFAAGAGFAVEADAARYTAGGVADVAIEAVGSIPALKAAMRSVRDGGRIVVLGSTVRSVTHFQWCGLGFAASISALLGWPMCMRIGPTRCERLLTTKSIRRQ